MNSIVKAYHLESQLELNKTRKWFEKYELLKREHTFLLYRINDDSYVYIKDYGSIVFFNCKEGFVYLLIQYLLGQETKINKLPSEEFQIKLNNFIKVDFGNIEVKEINYDVVHVIMLNLAQSVALMNYVNKTSELHNKTLVYSKQLERKGNFKLSKIQMRKFIGKTMNLKNSIAEDLFVFDSPDVAWNSKDLSDLDYKLKNELDIIKRHQGIQNSLNVIKENLDLFKDILQHKYSSLLEWIIIILILFEVIQVIVEKII